MKIKKLTVPIIEPETIYQPNGASFLSAEVIIKKRNNSKL